LYFTHLKLSFLFTCIEKSTHNRYSFSGGLPYVSLGAQKLPHFISVADKTININVSNLMKHLGLLTANAVSDMVTMAASGNEITLEEFLFSLLRHEVSSLAAHGATHLGEKYGRGELSYWQHKKMHFSLGAGVFFIKTTPELYWRKDKHIKEKLLAGMLGAGLGASVAEVVAEYYFYKGISGITSNNDEKLFKQKMNEMHQRAALLGKLSSVLVGLGCLNEISLSASYEAGSRAIDHNFLVMLIPIITLAIEVYEIYVICQNIVEIAEFINVVRTGDSEAIKAAGLNLATNLALNYATNKGVQYAGAKLIKLLKGPLGRKFFFHLCTKNNGMCPFAKKEIMEILTNPKLKIKFDNKNKGKGKNKIKPDPEYYGKDHMVIKRDADGKIISYATYKKNPKNPPTYVELEKRVDLYGSSHYNKVLDENIPTPHVHEKNTPGGVRPAAQNEIL
jgi:hypothetical protein